MSSIVRRVSASLLVPLLLAPLIAQEKKDKAKSQPPAAAAAFERFAKWVKVRWDAVWLYVESNGLPDHEMMRGIRAWQQQVPLPQDYTGDNAWQVPVKPVPAAQPKSAKTGFFRGAIAIAVNGVPIFNPIKNDGKTDTFLAGELDVFGGHAGRADDYHYHTAPVFLNGGDPSRPIAFALDGYPIYGYDEPDGSPVRPLDELNGHDDPKLGYHYHATKTWPYLNGGFHGEVREEGGQVDPQPHEHPVREATSPLRGAVITKFGRSKDGKDFTLTYEQRGKTGTVHYTLLDGGAVHFVFTSPDGTVREETYRADERKPGGGRPRGEGGDRGGERPRDGGAQRGPQDGSGAQPWLAAHLAEIDTDGDKVITRDELEAECATTLRGYDTNGDGKVAANERDARGAGRSAMGGFVKQHWDEVDTDHDGVVTDAEIRATAFSMFEHADRDRDDRVTETEASTRGGGGRQGGNGQGQGGGKRRGYAALDPGFQTDVPAHPYDVILVRPTATSTVVSVVAYADGEACVVCRAAGATKDERTPAQKLNAREPALFELSGLRRDTAYEYRLLHRRADGKEFAASEPFAFHTQRAANSEFTFTIQADSHLDSNMSPPVYERALVNARADRPDFHVDLGDTFMTDKRRVFQEAGPQYLAQRYWLGLLCREAPLFQVLGNHDGENGYAGTGADEIAGWSFAQRTKLFPPPLPGDGMFSGRTTWRDGKGAHWYAFEWGSALFCVLDPFWATTTRARGGGGTSETELTDESWRMSLGREQYDWLATTLAKSKAPWKFVFTHHLVGGRGRVARGGVEAAPFFEWGGKNADGSDGFAAHRPGWGKPIHRLLVENGVTAVFHGHDHLFVRSELDGVTYQCVPQPGNPQGGTRTAAEYGYASGIVLGSPGHLRVDVSPKTTKVVFVRAAIGANSVRRDDDAANGSIVQSYELQQRSRK